MSATVHRLPSRGTGSQLVTKKQLAAHLQRSERWVELRAQEGLPRGPIGRDGRRLFDLTACERWLAARSEKLERHEAPTVAERLEALEGVVAELRAEVKRLGGAT